MMTAEERAERYLRLVEETGAALLEMTDDDTEFFFRDLFIFLGARNRIDPGRMEKRCSEWLTALEKVQAALAEQNDQEGRTP